MSHRRPSLWLQFGAALLAAGAGWLAAQLLIGGGMFADLPMLLAGWALLPLIWVLLRFSLKRRA